MYQGHRTRNAYIEAWKAHVKQLRQQLLEWMFWETAADQSEVDAIMDKINQSIVAAADKLEARGEFESTEKES